MKYFYRFRYPLMMVIPCSNPFYRNVGNLREQAGGWVDCDHSIPSTTLTKLFARDSYRVITEQIFAGKQRPKKAIVTGSPGIGKSLFLIYILQKLVKQGKRVLFIYHPRIIYFDCEGGIFEFSHIPPYTERNIWNDTLWCLFDARGRSTTDLNPLPYNNCNFVLSISPNPSMVHDFKKPPVAKVFYMPIWSKDELQIISELFPHSDTWEERFRDLGGVPRSVFEATCEPSRLILKKACVRCDLAECTKITALDSNCSDVHALVHIDSEPPFTTSFVQYASTSAFETIVETKKLEARRNMGALLEACRGQPHAARLCARIFEDHAMELLQAGGTFAYRPLFYDGRTRTLGDGLLVIPASESRISADDIDSNHTLRRLHVPCLKKNVDAWIPGIGAFQTTVSMDYEISGETEAMLKLVNPKWNVLYWLLPPPFYDTFTMKNPYTLEQYAVLIPYPTQ